MKLNQFSKTQHLAGKIAVGVCLAIASVSLLWVSLQSARSDDLPAASGPSVTTDKADYAPGSTANITGSGFGPGEVVALQVNHADGTPDTGADHEPWLVVADANGSFSTTWHVCEDDCIGSTLLLTAVGDAGSSASATFTDGPPTRPDCTTCTTTATPNALPATVDGNGSEWSTADFWASLYNAGNSDTNFSGYALTANAFVRYQCDPDNTNVTVYVLVASSDPTNYPVLVSANDAWATVGGVNGKLYTGASVNDGSPPDFAWIGVGYDGDQTHALGYEASFKLPTANSPWNCFVIHVEVFNKIKSVGQTSGTETFNGPGKCLSVVCPAAGPTGCETLAASATAAPILCNGGDSTVTVSASGGTGAYTGTGTFTVKAGTYSYTVTDANGCSATTSVTVSEPTALVASSSATPVLCYGGDSTVTVSAGGGTGPYTGTGTFTVKAGTYTYNVTDKNGCSASTTVTITQPAAPVSVQVNSLAVCQGTLGTLTATASGGTGSYGYLWSNGATTPSINVSVAGSYSVTVSDANGCTAGGSGQLSYTTTTLSGKKFYDANANGANDDSQNVQGIKVTLSGNGIAPVTAYTAADGSYSFTGLLPGTYTVTETLPIGTWVNTTPLSQTVVVGCTPVTGVNFGNLCRSTPSNGFTLGFWANNNGQSVLSTKDTAWRALLNGYNLRNANGTFYTVPAGSFSTAYTSFKNWLLNATANNMAYMLSAQLSANVLDVAYKGLNANTVLVVSPSLKTLAGANVVNTLAGTAGFTVNASTGYGYISIGNLQAAAKASLLANGNTTLASAARTYQDCLKTLLDQSNNNGNPTVGSAYNVPLTVVSTTPCAFTYPY